MSRALLFAVALGLLAPGASAEEAPQKLGGSWMYRWGDFPAPTSGRAVPTDGWTTIAPLRTLPGQSADHVVWLRMPLPAGGWRDPAVLFTSVNGALEVYSGDRLLYQSGVIRPDGAETVDTSCWHLVELAPSDSGHELFVRLQSTAIAPGIVRSAYVGSRADLHGLMLSTGFGTLVVGLLLTFTFAIALAAWVRRRTNSSLPALAAFALASAALVFGFGEATPLVVHAPRFITRLEGVALCLFSPSFAWCLLATLPSLRRPRAPLVVTGLGIFGGFGALMAIVQAPGTQLLLTLNVLVSLIALVGGVVLCVRAAARGNEEARVLAFGFASLFLTAGWDTLPLFGIGEPGVLITAWGFFGIVVAFGAVIARRAEEVEDTLTARTRHLEERQQEVIAYSQRLEETAHGLVSVVDALRRSSDGQTQGVTHQAVSVRETQVTAEEIKRTSALAAEKAASMMQAATEAEAAGKSGEAALAQSLSGLQEIGTEVTEMTRRIAAAGSRTREIAGIVASVKDLAEQSNMLALNASIEAVRSGEAGRGFTIVAREVRRLADESSRATGRIKEVLDGLGDAIAGAVAISETGEKRVAVGLAQVRASSEQLQRLTGIVQQTSGHVRQISSAVTQQNAGVSQIVNAINDLSDQMEATLGRARDGEAIAAQIQQVVTSLRAGAEQRAA